MLYIFLLFAIGRYELIYLFNNPSVPEIADPLTNTSIEILDLESARLCDDRAHIRLKRRDQDDFYCPGDPTCISCHAQTLLRYEYLQEAFFHPDLVVERIAWYKKSFSHQKFVVVMGINYGQLYLFLNWACSVEALGIDPRRFTVVLATDFKTVQHLEQLGFFVVNPTWLNALKFKIDENYNRKVSNQGGHSFINTVILFVANELLNTCGYDILVHDVDIIWKYDIRDYLFRASRHRDILAMQSELGLSPKGPVNTGFMYFRNSYGAKNFLQTVQNVGGLKSDSDQYLFNFIVHDYRMVELELRLLPNDRFIKYAGKHHTPDYTKAYIFHAIGGNKLEKLEPFWFHTNQCSFFSQEIV